VSQTRDILRHLSKGHSLTPLQALEKFGTFRLAARVLEIEQQGHRVKRRMVKVGGARVAQYSIEEARR